MARHGKSTRQLALSTTALAAAALLTAGTALAQEPPRQADDPSASEDVSTVDEVVVTGSSIRGVPPTGSNLISVTREDIDRIGAADAAGVVATVPQMNSFNTAPQPALGGFGSFAPGMRGLPASATLPLMNGKRLVAAAANETNPDYPLLPSLAIQRIEVVADGASAIYGSDAVAGVVNFITRDQFTGAEVTANHGVAEDYDATFVGAILGRNWGTGSVTLAYQYSENDNILGADRDYRIQDFRPYGGIDTRATSCPLPNVLASTTFWSVYQAAPAFGLNTVNYCDSGAVADLVPRSRLHSAFLSGRQEIGEHVTLWGELLYTDRHDEIRVAPPAQTVFLFNTNPFFQGPPGATSEYVLFRPDNLIGADHFTNFDDRRVGNSSVGVDFQLPSDLKLTAYGSFDWAANDAFIPQIDAAALAAAAAGTTTDTALDPFGMGTSPAVVAAILGSSTDVDIEQRTSLAAVKLDGPLLDLPGGEMRFALGGEFRRETFEQRGFVGATAVPENLDRDITSIYGEVFIPLFGEGNRAPFAHSLSLSLSGRYDDYSDFGTTSNPKIGVNWELTEGFLLRGSYGTSFRAPGLRQVGATVGAYYLSAAQATTYANDPTRGAAQVNTVYLLGGNRDLQPEEATTYSFGLDLRPTWAPNLRASLTYYNIEYTDVIGTPAVPYVFTDPTFAALVYRNPTPAELATLLSDSVPVNLPSPLPAIGNVLDLRLNNFGIRNTDGLDFDVNYRWTTDFGSIFADLSGNYILNFDTQFSPGVAASNSLDLGVPRWTARATLGVEAGAFNAAVFVNYRDGIRNNFTTPTGVSAYEADAYVTVDLRVGWTLPAGGWTDGTVLTLQVDNVFDEDPPFFPATDGIGGSYNPVGRYVALNLRKRF